MKFSNKFIRKPFRKFLSETYESINLSFYKNSKKNSKRLFIKQSWRIFRGKILSRIWRLWFAFQLKFFTEISCGCSWWITKWNFSVNRSGNFPNVIWTGCYSVHVKHNRKPLLCYFLIIPTRVTFYNINIDFDIVVN